jgi:hypothetical protein
MHARTCVHAHTHALPVLLTEAQSAAHRASVCCWLLARTQAAYAELVQAGLCALPTLNHIRKLVAAAVTSSTGQDLSYYKDLGKEVVEWPDKMREVVLLYDEVNTVGTLTFKKVGGKFCFFGMVDEPHHTPIFVDPKAAPLTAEERITKMKAKDALVCQVVFLHDVHGAQLSDERILRRVVGVHAVNSPPAEVVTAIIDETIDNLEIYAQVSVVATSSDGASSFRLQQKYATSGQGRDTANVFVTTTRPNPSRSDRILNMLSDISHLMKKATTNLYKSNRASKSRYMQVPDYLAQMPFATRPFPGDAPGAQDAFSHAHA